MSIGKNLCETFLETGKAYTRISSSGGAELFMQDISQLNFMQENNLEQIEFDMKLYYKNIY